MVCRCVSVLSDLGMSRSSDMAKECYLVYRFLAAHVAYEGVEVAVVSHVHRVHCTVSERNVAMDACVSLRWQAFFREYLHLVVVLG